MNLLEVICEKGSNYCFTELRKKTFLVEMYRNFTQIEGGMEKGIPVREKVAKVLVLLEKERVPQGEKPSTKDDLLQKRNNLANDRSKSAAPVSHNVSANIGRTQQARVPPKPAASFLGRADRDFDSFSLDSEVSNILPKEKKPAQNFDYTVLDDINFETKRNVDLLDL